MPFRYPSIAALTPEQRHAAEIALPPIFTTAEQRAAGVWTKAFYDDRIDWYTQLTIESEDVRGGAAVIPEFIAGMIGEAGLNNRALGDSNAASTHFGVGWMQMDTEHHVHTLEHLLFLRLDPLYALEYATDPANGLCTQGGFATHFIKARWHAWTRDKIDPPLDDQGQPTGWSALGAAVKSYEKLIA